MNGIDISGPLLQQADARIYDPRCMEFSTAVGAILRAVGPTRRLWGSLEELGLNREEHEPILLMARDAELNPYNPDDLSLLFRMCPGLLYASLEMFRRYLNVTNQSRGNKTRKALAA